VLRRVGDHLPAFRRRLRLPDAGFRAAGRVFVRLAQLAVILSASTGAMAFIFGEYGAALLEVPENQQSEMATYLALAAVGVLTVINFFGVVLGKWVMNLLVLVKLLGLGMIILWG